MGGKVQNRAFTREELEAVAHLGAPIAAKRLGATTHTVRKWAKREGIKLAKPEKVERRITPKMRDFTKTMAEMATRPLSGEQGNWNRWAV